MLSWCDLIWNGRYTFLLLAEETTEKAVANFVFN